MSLLSDLAVAVKSKLDVKVDKVAGLGLSANDYTAAEKTKLGAISGTNTGDQVIPTSLPASDVSAWAKAATKPAYSQTEVGLANVSNTADAAKPVSSAQQTALDLKANQATTYTKVETDSRIQTVLGGVSPATLDTISELSAQMLSDESGAAALTTAVSLKAPINNPVFTGTVGGVTKDMVGLTNADNTTDLLKPVSTATQAALDLKADATTITTALGLKADTSTVYSITAMGTVAAFITALG